MLAWLALLASAPSSPDAVAIPPGSFLMGCVPADLACEPIERERHRVTLSRPFRLARTETSVRQYRRFAEVTGYRTRAEREGRGRYLRGGEWDWIEGLSWRAPFSADQPARDDWPAVQIAWEDADAYCRWAGGRLPTEAEWEYAARAGRDGAIHIWGDSPLPVAGGRPLVNGPDADMLAEVPSFAAFPDYRDGHVRLAPVGSFPANGFGLHDMAGNVYEWTADWIADAPYSPAPVTDPQGLATGEIKAVRGGGWGYPPGHFRISFRGFAATGFWTATFGFRCAWDRQSGR